jgi:hypothetical protein
MSSPAQTNPHSVAPGVTCDPAVLEDLRVEAIDGLLALPRVGMGVGGLLLGHYENGVINISGACSIDCAHAQGPSFHLTQDEVAAALRLAAASESEVAGWYFSRPRGTTALTAADAMLFDKLCPQPWQCTLVLVPSTIEPVRGTWHFRAGGAAVQSRPFDIQPWPSSESAAPEPELAPPPRPSPVPAQHEPEPDRKPQPASAAGAKPQKSEAPKAESKAPADQMHVAQPPAIEPPQFAAASPGRTSPWLAIAAGLVVALGGTALATRDYWHPRPPLRLDASDRQGHLLLRWNPEGLNGLTSAVMQINDNGDLHSVPLDATQLASGHMEYQRFSPRVTATLHAGETRAIALFEARTDNKGVTPALFDLPVRLGDAAALAGILLTQPEVAAVRPLTPEFRNRVSARLASEKFEYLRPLANSIERDPVHPSAIYICADGVEGQPVLLRIAPAKTPSSGIFPKSILIGRTHVGPEEVVINAIPFTTGERERILAFAMEIGKAFLPRPAGARPVIVVSSDAPATAFDAAFEGFRALQKKTGRNMAAFAAAPSQDPAEIFYNVLRSAIRTGWREGYTLSAPEPVAIDGYRGRPYELKANIAGRLHLERSLSHDEIVKEIASR